MRGSCPSRPGSSRPREVILIFKLLVCAALLFIALAAVGIWLQRWRGQP